jgi:hypothetical protein
VRGLAGGGLGFLLAVLWFDLMFDVQARHRDGDQVAAEARASISAYYSRVTTAARPMNQLVALAMLVTLGAIVGVLVRDELPEWRAVVALVLSASAIGLAGARTVRNAQRLGRATDDAATQSGLATRILGDHIFCFAAIFAALLTVVLPA